MRLTAPRFESEGWGQVKVACWALESPPPLLLPKPLGHKLSTRRLHVAPQSLHPLCLAAAGDKAKGRWGGWLLLVVAGSAEGVCGESESKRRRLSRHNSAVSPPSGHFRYCTAELSLFLPVLCRLSFQEVPERESKRGFEEGGWRGIGRRGNWTLRHLPGVRMRRSEDRKRGADRGGSTG